MYPSILYRLTTTSYYLRDASGNIMSVYEKVEEEGDVTSFNATEYTLYGSDRLGTYSRTIDITGMGGSGETPLEPGEERIMESTTKNAYEGVSYLLNPGVELTLGPGFTFEATGGASFHVRVAAENNGLPELEEGVYARLLNSRKYELKDHLGNVRALVSDVKKSTITNNTPGAYEPDVLALYNYYPFGMEQPGRTWPANNKDYRYGFNGKEKDQNGEWGMTNYDYGFRIYNPAIAKFLSVDPLTISYPWYTSYQFAGNKPIWAIDIDGLEDAKATYFWQVMGNRKFFGRTHSDWQHRSTDQEKINLVIKFTVLLSVHYGLSYTEVGEFFLMKPKGSFTIIKPKTPIGRVTTSGSTSNLSRATREIAEQGERYVAIEEEGLAKLLTDPDRVKLGEKPSPKQLEKAWGELETGLAVEDQGGLGYLTRRAEPGSGGDWVFRSSEGGETLVDVKIFDSSFATDTRKLGDLVAKLNSNTHIGFDVRGADPKLVQELIGRLKTHPLLKKGIDVDKMIHLPGNSNYRTIAIPNKTD